MDPFFQNNFYDTNASNGKNNGKGGKNMLTMSPAIPETENPETQITLLKKENSLLREEIKRLNFALGSSVIADSDIRRLHNTAKEIQLDLEMKYDQNVQISDHYDKLIEESNKQKEALRSVLDSKITLITENLGKIVQVVEETTHHLKSQNFEIVKEKVNNQIEEMNDKMLEFEHIISESQLAYRSRLEKILETRRQAEVNFSEERKKFVKVVKDLETAYVRKGEEYHDRVKREYELIEDSYFKLKHENGILLLIISR